MKIASFLKTILTPTRIVIPGLTRDPGEVCELANSVFNRESLRSNCCARSRVKPGMTIRGGNQLRKVIASLFILSVVTACGFHPIYQKSDDHSALTNKLSQIEIEDMPGRHGQSLKASLEDLFNPGAGYSAPLYTLTIHLRETNVPLAIERTGQITRYDINFTADYILKDNKTGKDVDHGSVHVVSGYDALDSRYSTFTAQHYTEDNTLQELAGDIQVRIVSALSK